MTVRRLHRSGRAPGEASLLPNAFAALGWPEEDAGHYLWAAMGHEGFRGIRAMARERLHSERDQHLIVSYWRRGDDEHQHAAAKNSHNSANKNWRLRRNAFASANLRSAKSPQTCRARFSEPSFSVSAASMNDDRINRRVSPINCGVRRPVRSYQRRVSGLSI